MKRRKKFLLLSLLFLLILAVAVLLYIYVPRSLQSRLGAVCRVEAQVCFALPLCPGDTLFLSLSSDSPRAISESPDSVARTTSLSGAFISYAGHVLTSDSLFLFAPDSLSAEATRLRLQELDTMLCRRLNFAAEALDELDYYARTHTVSDGGFNEVMDYREHLLARKARTTSLQSRLDSLLSSPALPSARLHVRTSVVFAAEGDFSRVEVDTLAAVPLLRTPQGLLLLQLDRGFLPAGARAISFFRIPAFGRATPLLGFPDFGGSTARTLPQALPADSLLEASACEGGVVVNSAAHLLGVRVHGQILPKAAVLGPLLSHHGRLAWWFLNVKGFILRLQNAPELQLFEGKVCTTPCAVLRFPDGSFYTGQVSRKGKGLQRQGFGAFTDSLGAKFTGVWAADTLAEGERLDSAGLFRGEFNSRLEAQGFGRLFLHGGGIYVGEWAAGLREGNGFAVGPGRIVQSGAWKSGKFLGERLVYTAERVYGIDISRYQHEIGRRRFGIDWSRLRITSLGPGQKVEGTTDFPVSYVYIKATQGLKIYNRYYAADRKAARMHGLATGSYHFFSTKADGARQARWFLKKATVASGDLPPMLDLEPTEAQIQAYGGEQKLFAEVLRWLELVEKSCAKKPVLYVSQTFVNRHLVNAPPALRAYDVWVARYSEFKPYVHLLHWQLTPRGRVRGIRGEVDINLFNGTREQFEEYRQAH